MSGRRPPGLFLGTEGVRDAPARRPYPGRPLCLLTAVAGVLCAGQDVSVFTQVGFVISPRVRVAEVPSEEPRLDGANGHAADGTL